MIEDNTYEENVKDFNRMLFKLDDKDFNWDTHAMIDNVVVKIEVEYMINYVLDDSNVIYIDRFRDVLKWADHQKFMSPGGSIPPISVPVGRDSVVLEKHSRVVSGGRDKVVPKRRKQLVIPSGRGFAVGRNGRRRRKKYL